MSYLLNYKKWSAIVEAEQANVPAVSIAARLENLTPGIGNFLKAALATKEGSASMVMNLGTQVAEYVYEKNGTGAGTLNVYRINNTYTIPVPALYYSFQNSEGSAWATRYKPSDIVTVDQSNIVKDNFNESGQDNGTRLANLWKSDASWLANATNKVEVLNKAVAAVSANTDIYHQKFLRFTRSESGIKQFWKDNPQVADRSQFSISFLRKIPKDSSAFKVYSVIKDVELENVIKFKTDPGNFKSDGVYPDIKIPAVIV